jgi:hypothetical protein
MEAFVVLLRNDVEASKICPEFNVAYFIAKNNLVPNLVIVIVEKSNLKNNEHIKSYLTKRFCFN